MAISPGGAVGSGWWCHRHASTGTTQQPPAWFTGGPGAPNNRRERAERHNEATAEAREAQEVEHQRALKLRFDAQKELLDERLRTEKETAQRAGETHTDRTLAVLGGIAQAYRDFGDFEGERKQLDELQDAVVDLKGKEHKAYITTIVRLAVSHGRMGENQLRVELLEGLLPLLDKVYKDLADVPHVVAVLNQLADAYEAVGDDWREIEALVRVVEAMDQFSGIASADVAQTLNRLVTAYTAVHAYDKVVQLLENRLPPLIAQLGAMHPHVFVAWMHLALAYGHQGRREDQLGLYDTLFGHVEEVFGSDMHPLALVMRRNRAVARIVAGRGVQDALIELSDVCQSMSMEIGPRNAETFVALHALADGYARAERFEDAIREYDELLVRMEADGAGGVGFDRIVEDRNVVAMRLRQARSSDGAMGVDQNAELSNASNPDGKDEKL